MNLELRLNNLEVHEVQSRDNELRRVFRDGKLMIDEDLTQIRDRAAAQL